MATFGAKRLFEEVEKSPSNVLDQPLSLTAIAKLLDEKLDEKLEPINAYLNKLESKINIAVTRADEAFIDANSAMQKVLDLKQEVTELKLEMNSIKSTLVKQESLNMQDCLNFYNIPEEQGENCETKLKDIFLNNMDIQSCKDIKFTKVFRVGRKTPDKTRPIRARFHFMPDLDSVFTSRKRLQQSTKIRVSKVYPPEVETNRKKMFPAVNAAFNHRNSLPKSEQGRYIVHFVEDRLYINNKMFNVHNLDELPLKIQAQNNHTTETDTHVYYWTKNSVFSNHYKSPFTLDGKVYNCVEQYAMEQKALLFNDRDTAKIVR